MGKMFFYTILQIAKRNLQKKIMQKYEEVNIKMIIKIEYNTFLQKYKYNSMLIRS